MKKLSFYLLVVSLFWLACGKKEASTESAVKAASVDSTRVLSPSEVLGIAIIEPAGRLVEMASEQSGVVTKLHATIGQELKAGAPILQLTSSLESAQLAQARSKIASQNSAIISAKANLQLLQVRLTKAQADLQREEDLFRGKAITQQQLDDARAQIPDLNQQIRAQEAVVKEQEMRVGERQADIQYFQTALDQRMVRAPASGTVLSLDIREGEFLNAQTPFGEFAPAGPVIAVTEIDELFADRVQVGQIVLIRPQGSDNILTTGKVVLTSPYLRRKSLFSEKAGDLEDRRVREVRVQLDDPSKVLLGARVECLIQL